MKTRTIAMASVLVCSLVLSIGLQSQDAGIEGKIKQLQQDQINAQMKNDVAWAQEHLAEGFIAGHSWGKWETKADYIKNWESKVNKWSSGNISDVRVSTFGADTAVVHYRFTYDATFKGTHRAQSVICTDTWVNDSGAWKSAANHCSVSTSK